MPKYTINNTSIYYEVHGSGPPLIFTHGASLNYQQWKNQVDYFKSRYKVIVWDVRGHGNSSLPVGSVNNADFAQDLIGLMDLLNLKSATLVGLSMGGHISLRVAIEYPDRVNGLVLIGTPCSNSFNIFHKITVPLNRLSNRVLPKAVTAKLMAKALSKYNPNNYQYILDSFALIPHSNWIRLWTAITKMESKDELHKVLCPTILLIGEHDNLTSSMQTYMKDNIANSKLVTIKNAHHGTNLDNPKDVNKEILKFLQTIKGVDNSES